jgi:hypothetical protein
MAALVAFQVDRKLEEPHRAGLDIMVIKRKTPAPVTDQTLVILPIHRLLTETSELTLTWKDVIKMIK